MIMVRFFLFLMLSMQFIQATQLKKLPDLVAYADGMPKKPKNEEPTNWEDPKYKSFHESIMPTFMKRLQGWLGIKTYIFPINDFQTLLKEVTRYRERIFPRGRLIQKITPESDSFFIIWGELNGAFHSLVRCLQELRKQELIDDTLTIVHSKTYFVFNGDVIDKSPYILETLMVILLLMKQNPQHVFYLKGVYEDKERWMKEEFGYELRIRARSVSTETIPMAGMLRRFFGTLPLALYLIPPDQTGQQKDIVRISPFGPDTLELDESAFAYFFDAYTKPIVSILKKEPRKTDVSVDVKAYVQIEDRRKKYTPSEGLVLLSEKAESVRAQWAVISSPTASFRRLYQFFYDAYTILHTAEALSDWTITVFNQDAEKEDGFKRGPTYYLTSGKLATDIYRKDIALLKKQLLELQQHNERLKAACPLPLKL